MSATAFIAATSGRAVIQESSGKLYVLEVDKPGILQDGEGVHLGMFLQPAMTGVEKRDAGSYPYEDTVSYLNLAYRRNRALVLFLTMIDVNMATDNIPNDCADLVEQYFSDSEVMTWVEQICMEPRLPDVVDANHGPKDGRAGELFRKMIKKWRG